MVAAPTVFDCVAVNVNEPTEVPLEEWVVIDLQNLSNEEILETYCHFTDWHIASIVDIPDGVGTFPANMLLVVA